MACKPTPHSTCLTIHGFRKTDKCSRTTIGYIRATGLYTVGIAASWENRVGWEYGEHAIEFGENLSDFATHCLGGVLTKGEIVRRPPPQAPPQGRPLGIAPTIHGLAKPIRGIVGAIPSGRAGYISPEYLSSTISRDIFSFFLFWTWRSGLRARGSFPGRGRLPG